MLKVAVELIGVGKAAFYPAMNMPNQPEMAHAATLLQNQESLGEAVTMYKKKRSSITLTPLMTPFVPCFARFVSSLHETVLSFKKHGIPKGVW